MDTDALRRLVEQADFVLRAKAGRSKPWTAIEAEGFAPTCQAAMGNRSFVPAGTLKVT
jgi:hypothetical protein